MTAARASSSAEIAQASKVRAAAQKVHEAALAAAREDSSAYTPLSPVYPARSTGRRAALARWITGRTNPLAARVAVNYIWRWHFGTPLVATTHDFGRNGAAPSHPELLNWLAVELMEPTAPGVSPWSMKSLHRRIVTSTAYRMASHPNDRSPTTSASSPASTPVRASTGAGSGTCRSRSPGTSTPTPTTS